MSLSTPIDPNRRIVIIDILRGFALLGIIFMNMSFFSGYLFLPFEELKQISNFGLDEQLYNLLAIVVTGKFYTIFSILFAVGFHIQFNKNRDSTINFLKTYRRRLFILLFIGILHTLFWYGDILLTYSVYGFILILFRNMKPQHLLRWSLFFLCLPFLLDFALLPFTDALLKINPPGTGPSIAHLSYPDMSNTDLINTFRQGSITEIFMLNIHNSIWKQIGYIPSGGYFIFLGIFLLGYYLASVDFFTKTPKSIGLIFALLISGVVITILSKHLGGNPYAIPTLQNIRYKFLTLAGQLLMSFSYIMAIIKLAQTVIGKRILEYLIPVGRMALTNYILQTAIMVLIYYSFGFGLFGKTGLMSTFIVSMIIVAFQVVLSNIWLKYYRFGPLEWVWRSLTYKKWINIRH